MPSSSGKSGVKGEPLFAKVDTNARNGPAARFAYGVGTVIDLPFSIAFDTILLPLDLFRPKKPAEDSDAKSEPDGETQ